MKPVSLLDNPRFAHCGFFRCCRKALEDLGIPCFLGGMSRGLLGKDSPIHIRQNRRDALKEADLVLLAGEELIRSGFALNVCPFRKKSTFTTKSMRRV